MKGSLTHSTRDTPSTSNTSITSNAFNASDESKLAMKIIQGGNLGTGRASLIIQKTCCWEGLFLLSIRYFPRQTGKQNREN